MTYFRFFNLNSVAIQKTRRVTKMMRIISVMPRINVSLTFSRFDWLGSSLVVFTSESVRGEREEAVCPEHLPGV